ncbi:MAG: patatin-like phospholipase family protein [Pseudomonadales bacterium]
MAAPRPLRALVIMALCLLAATATGAPASDPAQPRIGLVLGGGGARGAAHVGVIRVLEQAGVRPDVIVGTSMGAIVGGLYAAGLNADQLQRVLEDMDWDRMFADDPGRRDRTIRRKQLDRDFVVPRRLGFSRRGLTVPLGVLQGQQFDTALKRILGRRLTVRDFDRLPIPFRAVATDIATGDPVVLASGSLVQAIRASMSVPGVFAPVTIDDRLLVDGGLAMNIPVQVAQALGADVLIVVDLSQPLLAREQIDSVLKVTDQLSNFLTRRNSQHSLSLLSPRDILIQPELGDISSIQFERSLEAAEQGAAAAERQHDALLAIANRDTPVPPSSRVSRVRLDFIELNNGSSLDDAILLNRLSLSPGDRFDVDQLEADLNAIYALDVFDAVRYDIVRDPERGTGVVINAEPRTWGPNYLQFGLGLVTDFDAITDFSIGAAYTRNAINRLGADLRVSAAMGRFAGVEADLHQPLDYRGEWFAHPALFWARDGRDLFDGTRHLGEVDIDRWGARLGGGRNFGPRAQLRLDYLWARESVEVASGIAPGDLLGNRHVGELALSGRYDSLNNVHFPTRGSLVELTLRRSIDAIGADEAFTQGELTSTTAWTRGRWSLLTRTLVGISSDDEIPLASRYRLGGFGRLSGLPPDSLFDRNAALLAVSGQRRIADLRLLPIYAGASLEAGNTWNDRADMGFGDLRHAASLYLGIDSFLGPWYLAFGVDDDGHQSFYFHLGNPFELRRR